MLNTVYRIKNQQTGNTNTSLIIDFKNWNDGFDEVDF